MDKITIRQIQKTSLVIEKRNNFTDQLDNLFDIVSMSNSSQASLSELNKSLLNSLRLNKRVKEICIMESEVNAEGNLIEERSASNEKSKSIKRKRGKKVLIKLKENIDMRDEDYSEEDHNDDNVDDDDDDNDDADLPNSSTGLTTKRKTRLDVMSDEFCAVLDRTKICNT